MKTAKTYWSWVLPLILWLGPTGLALAGEMGVTEDRQVVDFNGDGTVDVEDLNDLLKLGPLAEGFRVEPGAPFVYDLNRDGWVNMGDVSVWLNDAAAINHLPSAYPVGDGNLDGLVDIDDFKLWNSAKFSASLAWDDGDYNCDGWIDVSDFNVWNSYRSGTPGSTYGVPEPMSNVILAWATLGAFAMARVRRRP